jgi:2-oxoglutarate ferredoxin oxidoreductase subunit beta
MDDTAKTAKAWRKETKPHRFCPGCGHGIILRALGDALDELGIHDKAIFGCDIGCSLLSWDYFNLDSVQTHHGRTTPVMTGLKRARPDLICIAYMGDGGGYAIGAQHLLNSAVRNEKITVILCNNTVYAMTGGQMAPTTLEGQKTETTPFGRDVASTGYPIMGPEIVSAATQEGAYIARGIITQYAKLKRMLKKSLINQIEGNGFSFVEVLSSCPTNWRTNAKDTLKFVNEDMANYFNVGEIKIPQSMAKESGR